MLNKRDFVSIDAEKELRSYALSLTEREKEVLHEAWDRWYLEGRSFLWMYFVIQQLGGRSILQCRNLIKYKGFVDDVTDITNAYYKWRERKVISLVQKDYFSWMKEKRMYPIVSDYSFIDGNNYYEVCKLYSSIEEFPQNLVDNTIKELKENFEKNR